MRYIPLNISPSIPSWSLDHLSRMKTQPKYLLFLYSAAIFFFFLSKKKKKKKKKKQCLIYYCYLVVSLRCSRVLCAFFVVSPYVCFLFCYGHFLQARAHEIGEIGKAEAAAILAKGEAEAKVGPFVAAHTPLLHGNFNRYRKNTSFIKPIYIYIFPSVRFIFRFRFRFFLALTRVSYQDLCDPYPRAPFFLSGPKKKWVWWERLIFFFLS